MQRNVLYMGDINYYLKDKLRIDSYVKTQNINIASSIRIFDIDDEKDVQMIREADFIFIHMTSLDEAEENKEIQRKMEYILRNAKKGCIVTFHIPGYYFTLEDETYFQHILNYLKEYNQIIYQNIDAPSEQYFDSYINFDPSIVKSEETDSNVIQLLYGPNAFIEVVYGKKIIYLLGDTHHKKSTCSDIGKSVQDLIEMTLESNPRKTIDIYLEQDDIYEYNQKYVDYISYKPLESYMNNVYKRFEGCFSRKNKKCPYDSARFHHIDVRSSVALDPFTYFLDPSVFFEKITKIEKQIQNIEDPDIRSYFNGILENMIQEKKRLYNEAFFEKVYQAKKRFIELTEQQRPGDKKIKKEKTDLINSIFNDPYYKFDIFNFNSMTVDLYSLSRIFRSYKGSEDSNYNIVYAGNNHIKKMLFMMMGLPGFSVEKNVFNIYYDLDKKSEKYQCIDLTEFPNQPLFIREPVSSQSSNIREKLVYSYNIDTPKPKTYISTSLLEEPKIPIKKSICDKITGNCSFMFSKSGKTKKSHKSARKSKKNNKSLKSARKSRKKTRKSRSLF